MRFKPTELATIIVAGIALLGTLATALYTYTARNRELDIELVKIGIGILRADPKETQTASAREWAVRLIERHSGQAFSEKAKAELLENQLIFPTFYDTSWETGPGFTGGNLGTGKNGFGDPAPCLGGDCTVAPTRKQQPKQPQPK
jgi:hypothetical protein